ncbi:hypothetical protein GQ457_11G024440 [Hibiscus cannabinus]
MVDMKCEGCVNAVKRVKSVEVDLRNQVVRILGSSPVKTMSEAVEQIGRKARLIGQGVPDVRLAQVSMELARMEANFSGLSPRKHGWSSNEFGDLTRVFVLVFALQPTSDLGTLDVDTNGEAFYTGVKQQLRVADLIGRSIAVYETEDRSDPGVTLTAAVIARSARVGENYKKICASDGTTIWLATDKDFVTSKKMMSRCTRNENDIETYSDVVRCIDSRTQVSIFYNFVKTPTKMVFIDWDHR